MVSPRGRVAVALIILAAGSASGCGVSNPYTQERTRAQTTATSPAAVPARGGPSDRAAAAPRSDATPPALAVSTGPFASTAAAIHSFALRWTNWSWRDPDGQSRSLAAMATGPLATTLGLRRLTAADRTTLRRERTASVGTIVIERPDAGGALVVVRTTAYAGGETVAGGLHWSVFRATVRHTADGWKVARWQELP